jgi:hypothetical protein
VSVDAAPREVAAKSGGAGVRRTAINPGSARRDTSGACLILALSAIVTIIALIFLGGQVSKILSNVGHSV